MNMNGLASFSQASADSTEKRTHPNRDITRCSSIGRVFALGAKEYRFNSNHLDVHDITCDDREDT